MARLLTGLKWLCVCVCACLQHCSSSLLEVVQLQCVICYLQLGLDNPKINAMFVMRGEVEGNCFRCYAF